MLAEIQLLMLPYAGEKQMTVLHLLINELKSSNWSRFFAAVAFAKQSGNYQELIEAMVAFAERGNTIELTFGADTFGPEGRGSEYEAIGTLLEKLGKYTNVKMYLYHEKARTFHPKIYVFANESDHRALLMIGSSNWSAGGFHDNIEANVIIGLDLTKGNHQAFYNELQEYFASYWQERLPFQLSEPVKLEQH